MSDSAMTEDNAITPDTESGIRAKADQVSSVEETAPPTPDSSLTPSFDKLQVQSDSESSGDEVTAFDRVRESSDSDEADDKTMIGAIPAAREKSPEPKQFLDSLPEDKLDESVSRDEVKEEVLNPESPVNAEAATPLRKSHDVTTNETAVEETGKQESKEENQVPQQTENGSYRKSPEANTSGREYGYEREKGKKYSYSKDAYREKGGRWKHNQEDSFRDENRRERGKSRSNREDRGTRRENFTSYGHDDRFYVSQDTRPTDTEVDPAMFQGRSPPRIWKGARGRGGEGKWKHDKFYEDEQGPIDLVTNEEPANNNISSYQSLQSVSQYPDKKGRGRGNKKTQYNDTQAPIPGFSRNSPRQERRGRGSKPYREEPDAYYANTRSNRGRGVNRYNDSYKDENVGMYLSKPIVFVSQNKKNEPSYVRQKQTEIARTPHTSSDVASSGYIQSSASTPLPTIPVLSTKSEIDSKESRRIPQVKNDPYHKISSSNIDKYNSSSNSSYVGLGRGKGKLMHPVSLLQRGQEYKRPTDTVKHDYEKDVVSEKEVKESLPLTSESSPTFPYKSQGHHKPERYSTQRFKQTQFVDMTIPTTTGETTSGLNVSSPTSNPSLNSSKQKPPNTQEQVYNPSMSMGEHPQYGTRSGLMDVQYSEFYPSPYKEEMVGTQMSPMHPYNIMPDYMMGPDVMKEGDFQQMQFPPFIPQEMNMNMKGTPNMMGGIPFMGSPQLGPEYMMGNDIPPNLQSDLFVPMQSFYPPI